MRKIRYKNQFGDMELDVEDLFVNYIARRNGIDICAITDADILRFFNLASTTALDKAAAEYVAINGKDT